jgi:hypothetical protein
MNQLVRERNGAVAGVRRIRIRASGATTSAAVTTISSADLIEAPPGLTSSAIEDAVYAHLQAMRALGHTRVNTTEVARALGLPLELVDATIASLVKRGVKVV